MTFAVELYFDGKSETVVREVWESLANAELPSLANVPGCRPHVSLGVCGNLDIPEFSVALSGFAKSVRPFPIRFSSIGFFPTEEGVIYLGVTVTRALLALHERIFTLFEGGASEPWRYYAAGRWVPNCKLAYGLREGEWGAALEVVRRVPFPKKATVEQIEPWTYSLCAARSFVCSI